MTLDKSFGARFFGREESGKGERASKPNKAQKTVWFSRPLFLLLLLLLPMVVILASSVLLFRSRVEGGGGTGNVYFVSRLIV